jgi:hypothetical protein
MEDLKDAGEKKLLGLQQQLETLKLELSELKYGSIVNQSSKDVRDKDAAVYEVENKMVIRKEKYFQLHSCLEGCSVGLLRVAELLGEGKVSLFSDFFFTYSCDNITIIATFSVI